ncbi:MAG TPA: DUF5916 domain-containing protein [Thermoanaerobaculia bacterium]
MRRAALLALFLAVPAVAAEQALPPPAPITITKATGPITIDGDLSDAGWRDAAKIDRFYETSPGNNSEPKVKTTAYLTYDDRAFYIGVRAEDPQPNRIRAPYVERDNVLGTDDNIAVFLDTRNDKRTALELRVNPRGIQGDAIFNDANGNEDFSPDFFYDTAAKIDSGGWSAEYRIPFSSLRYPHADVQHWNILVWRNYPREFRYAFHSAPIDRSSNCLVCHAHPIVGLAALPEAGHLIAAPYVTGQQTERPANVLGSPLERAPFHRDAGADVKWTPTANNAVDVALNPDFSQVESDVAQITANQRFAVFFPEKRPFFLEGSDLFDTPLQVVYTRTITSPRWGVRSTGRFAGSTYTMLVTQDRGGGLTVIPGATSSFFAPEDFGTTDAVGRIRHDFGSSFIGGVFTDRQIRGGGHNLVIGPDFQWRPSESDEIAGEVLVSDTSNPNRLDLSGAWNGSHATSHALHFDWNHQRQSHDFGFAANDLGRDFRADLGFLPQVGYREADGYGGLRWYPQHSIFSFVRASFFVDQQMDMDGRTVFRRSSPGIGANGAKNLFLGVTVHPVEQYRVGNALLKATFVEFNSQIDPTRRLPRIGLNATGGQRIDFANGRVGNGATIGVFSTIRPIDRLTFDATVSREWLNLQGERLYTAAVERLKTTYSFSAQSLVRVIGQYVSTNRNPALYSFATGPHDGSFLGSILYSYKVNWQTVLFVGYGDDRLLTENNVMAKLDRSLFFKVSYAIQR